MLVKSNDHLSAGFAAWNSCNRKVSYSKCCDIAEIVETLPIELPTGISEKAINKLYFKQVRSEAVKLGIISGGIFAFLFQAAVVAVIRMMVEHWIKKSGWV